MPSQNQIAANRRNAQRSTGPRTPRGKCRSRKNAMRHGLCSKAIAHPTLISDIDDLAKRIAREHGKPDESPEARMAAEAEIRILRARTLRAKLLDMMAKPATQSRQLQFVEAAQPCDVFGLFPGEAIEGNNTAVAYLQALPVLVKLERHERNAFTRRRLALNRLLFDLL